VSAGAKGSSQISVQMLAFPSSSLSLLAVCQSLYASIFTRSGSHLYNPTSRQAARRGLLGGHRLGAAGSVAGGEDESSTRPPNPSTTPSSFYAKPPTLPSRHHYTPRTPFATTTRSTPSCLVKPLPRCSNYFVSPRFQDRPPHPLLGWTARGQRRRRTCRHAPLGPGNGHNM